MSWFKKKPSPMEIRLQALEDTMNKEITARMQAEDELQLAQQELTVLREQNKVREDRYKSPEPWMEIVSDTYDQVRGLEIKMDWNPAFIKYLQENGFDGKEEDIIVQKYIALLFQDVASRMDATIIEKKERQTISDYM